MDTTIQISTKLRDALHKRKMHEKESYENIIWDAIEDSMEISEEAKRDFDQALIDYSKGKFKKFSDFKKERGL